MNAPQMTPAVQAAFATARQPATAAAESDFERLMRRDFNPIDLLDGDSMDKMVRLAEQMAASTVSVPDHLRGKVGDCLAIVTQAMLWNMNPFAVAQKTHLVSGRLGYEAQLVIAVVMNSGAIRGAFRYEYRGEGNSLECRCGAVLRSDTEVTWGEWLRSLDVTTKNSPLWKTNPRQQLGYLQAKNWSRLHVPGAILGVYSVDELEDSPLPPPRGAAEAPAAPPPLPAYQQADFEKNLPAWTKLVADGKKSAADLLATLSTKATFTEQQRTTILALKPRATDAAPPPAAPAEPSFGDDSMGPGGGK